MLSKASWVMPNWVLNRSSILRFNGCIKSAWRTYPGWIFGKRLRLDPIPKSPTISTSVAWSGCIQVNWIRHRSRSVGFAESLMARLYLLELDESRSRQPMICRSPIDVAALMILSLRSASTWMLRGYFWDTLRRKIDSVSLDLNLVIITLTNDNIYRSLIVLI